VNDRPHEGPAGRAALLHILIMTLALPVLVATGITLADWQPGLQMLTECPPVMAQAEGRQP